MKTCIALCAIVLAVSANLGMDLSIYTGTVSVSQYQCLQQKGFSFMIIEEYVEGSLAHNFEINYKNAIAAGIKQVDAYAFICNTCKGGHTAAQTFASIKSGLPSGFNGMVWLDIEPCSGCWSSNGETNYVFATSVAQQLTQAGYKVGVYTSQWAWGSVMPGVKATGMSQYPLWYSHYDNVENFSDSKLTKFQGWTQGAIKQYAGDKKGICNVEDYDLDYSNGLVHTNGASTPTPAGSASKSASKSASNAGSASQSQQEQPTQTQQSQQGSGSASKSSAQAANPNNSSSGSKSSAQASQSGSGSAQASQSGSASAQASQSGSGSAQASQSGSGSAQASQSASSSAKSSSAKSSSAKSSSYKTSSQ